MEIIRIRLLANTVIALHWHQDVHGQVLRELNFCLKTVGRNNFKKLP